MGQSILVGKVLYACISNLVDKVCLLKQLLLPLPHGAPTKFLMDVHFQALFVCIVLLSVV